MTESSNEIFCLKIKHLTGYSIPDPTGNQSIQGSLLAKKTGKMLIHSKQVNQRKDSHLSDGGV